MVSSGNARGRAKRAVAVLAVLSPLSVLLAASCDSSPDKPACVAVDRDAGCAPLYEPVFDQIFSRTLLVSCARSGVSCHAATGRQGGLAFVDPDESYRLLLENGRVRPGDPSCSELVVRILSTDKELRMPPGIALPDGERCAIITWISNGAKR